MKIKLISTHFEGEYAAPKDPPITCANPAPWKITEVKIGHRFIGNESSSAIFIRGEESMWFALDNCSIGEEEPLKEWLTERDRKNKEPKPYTMRQAHEDAAGMNLEDSFFWANNIDPDQIVKREEVPT